MIHQAHIFVSGFVQGVGYRHFVRKNAQELGLRGWVRNMPARNASASVAGGHDNRVEALLQGPKEKIEQVIAHCRKGPFLAEVDDVEVIWEDAQEIFSAFEIL